jgi:peptidoglycan/xylan/chitin deacetylase (PgdA/CDA1 family)
MKFVRPPYAVRKLYSSLIWRMPSTEKKVYLTFDDGPIPTVTPWVLEVLKKHNAQATFFCIGENVEKHPEVYEQILTEGHAVGNHTYNHLNGWKTRDEEYFRNIEKCATLVNSKLFRPPYGKIKRSQIKNLTSHISHLKSIIMWDVLSYDYDPTVSPEKCLRNVLRYTRPGSIIVFHDSLKARKNLEYVLPTVLEQLSLQGFEFDIFK